MPDGCFIERVMDMKNTILNYSILDNQVYLYDGTFDGLLTIVFDCYLQKSIPNNITPETGYLPNLLEQPKYIATDEAKAKRIWNGIYHSISYTALYDCYYSFLSCQKDKEMLILKYLLHGFAVGSRISNQLSVDYVMRYC